ncbi:unannotated protein [freshwater metagenome]|uniref:Unannotated protein n=1 Tax=freshwater metagenome TaxID=449393 RepID=A0A6J6CV20_9ZZZZ
MWVRSANNISRNQLLTRGFHLAASGVALRHQWWIVEIPSASRSWGQRSVVRPRRPVMVASAPTAKSTTAHASIDELVVPVVGSVPAPDTTGGAVVVDAGALVVDAGAVVVEVVKVNAVCPLTTHSGWYSDAHVIFTLIARVTVPTSLTCILAKLGYEWRFNEARSRVPFAPKFCGLSPEMAAPRESTNSTVPEVKLPTVGFTSANCFHDVAAQRDALSRKLLIGSTNPFAPQAPPVCESKF